MLSGRYIQIDMLPFSFKEYYEATKESGRSKGEIFDTYLRYGSFPYVAYLEKGMCEECYEEMEGEQWEQE